MTPRLVLPAVVLVGFAGLAAPAAAQDSSLAPTAWRRLPSGLELRVAKTPLKEVPLSVTLVRFDPTAFRLRVAVRQPQGARVADFAESADVLAAVNANLSDGDNCAIGWVVAGSEDIGRLRRNLGGVLVVHADGSARVWRALHVPLEPAPVDAVQAGDLLVFEGYANPSLRGGLARRSFAGTDQEGRVVLGLTSGPMRPTELARFLSRKESAGGAELAAALAFEEGQSSQLFVRGAHSDDGDLTTGDARPVPTSLVVEKR